MKACRYSNAGKSSEGIYPSTSHYLGAVNDQVTDDYGSGVLARSAKDAEKDAADVDVATGRLLPPCTSSITASRPTSYARGSTDQAGLIGVVCAHIFPALGLFVALWTPENFSYYVYVLKELLKRRPDLVIVYLDVACRFKKRWDTLVDELVGAGLATAEAKKIGLLLPWMHAFDHNLECQVQFSGLLKVCCRSALWNNLFSDFLSLYVSKIPIHLVVYSFRAMGGAMVRSLNSFGLC